MWVMILTCLTGQQLHRNRNNSEVSGLILFAANVFSVSVLELDFENEPAV